MPDGILYAFQSFYLPSESMVSIVDGAGFLLEVVFLADILFSFHPVPELEKFLLGIPGDGGFIVGLPDANSFCCFSGHNVFSFQSCACYDIMDSLSVMTI